jgi:hypothetical protein
VDDLFGIPVSHRGRIVGELTGHGRTGPVASQRRQEVEARILLELLEPLVVRGLDHGSPPLSEEPAASCSSTSPTGSGSISPTAHGRAGSASKPSSSSGHRPDLPWSTCSRVHRVAVTDPSLSQYAGLVTVLV